MYDWLVVRLTASSFKSMNVAYFGLWFNIFVYGMSVSLFFMVFKWIKWLKRILNVYWSVLIVILGKYEWILLIVALTLFCRFVVVKRDGDFFKSLFILFFG